MELDDLLVKYADNLEEVGDQTMENEAFKCDKKTQKRLRYLIWIWPVGIGGEYHK